MQSDSPSEYERPQALSKLSIYRFVKSILVSESPAAAVGGGPGGALQSGGAGNRAGDERGSSQRSTSPALWGGAGNLQGTIVWHLSPVCALTRVDKHDVNRPVFSRRLGDVPHLIQTFHPTAELMAPNGSYSQRPCLLCALSSSLRRKLGTVILQSTKSSSTCSSSSAVSV